MRACFWNLHCAKHTRARKKTDFALVANVEEIASAVRSKKRPMRTHHAATASMLAS